MPGLIRSAVLLAAVTGALSAQERPLGPHDTSVLPATDTARVGVGQSAPDFTLATRSGARVTLSDFRGKKRVILVFYRGHW